MEMNNNKESTTDISVSDIFLKHWSTIIACIYIYSMYWSISINTAFYNIFDISIFLHADWNDYLLPFIGMLAPQVIDIETSLLIGVPYFSPILLLFVTRFNYLNRYKGYIKVLAFFLALVTPPYISYITIYDGGNIDRAGQIVSSETRLVEISFHDKRMEKQHFSFIGALSEYIFVYSEGSDNVIYIPRKSISQIRWTKKIGARKHYNYIKNLRNKLNSLSNP